MIKEINDLLRKNATDLLLTTGVVSLLGSTVLAVKNTPKAHKKLIANRDKSKLEKFKKVAPCYISSVTLAGVGIASIVASRNISKQKLTAIATAYGVSQTTLKAYRKTVDEILDDKEKKEFKEKVADKIIYKKDVKDENVRNNSDNKHLFYDTMSGRYFRSTINEIDKAVNEINKHLMLEMTMNLNDFYYEIGLEPIKIGCDLGWHIDKGMLEVHYNSCIADNDEPCILLEYDTESIF